MKRKLLDTLTAWRTDPLKMPIILRGARQVGKSWLIEEFGKQFESFINLNFEKQKKAKTIFDADIDIPTIIEKLSLYARQSIIPGKTLLFFDEAQECENCLVALRYFKEECPELHVIAAGSLIDFSLEKIGIPVGRVQFLYLYPLSFSEFLIANNRDDLCEYIYTQKSYPEIHEIINDYLKTYLWLGGMPAVVDIWIKHKDAIKCQARQESIVLSYKQDFEKYARKNQIEHVVKVFESIIVQLGAKFKYTNVDDNIKAAPIKEALFLLIKAGIAHPCYHSSGQSKLLGAEKDTKKFKIFFVDIGLAQKMLGLNLKNWVTEPLELEILGGLAEQLVAQEFVAYSKNTGAAELYYWHRENKGSNAEVDFLFLKSGQVIPIEVKSGRKGGMKSLKSFLETHPHSNMALKISNNVPSKHGFLEEIPLYGIEGWVRN